MPFPELWSIHVPAQFWFRGCSPKMCVAEAKDEDEGQVVGESYSHSYSCRIWFLISDFWFLIWWTDSIQLGQRFCQARSTMDPAKGYFCGKNPLGCPLDPVLRLCPGQDPKNTPGCQHLSLITDYEVSWYWWLNLLKRFRRYYVISWYELVWGTSYHWYLKF